MTTQQIIPDTQPSAATAAEAPAAPWWRREPLSVIELADPLHVAKFGRAGFDPQRVVARMKQLNATAAHIHPMGCHLDGRTMFFRHRSPGDPPPAFDYVDEWLKHSIAAGLRTIVYVNVHSVKLHHAQRHPDWQHRLIDGAPKENVYNVESAFCVNGPWRDWVFDRLRELCAYPIDGIFFDGPVFFDDDCYCRHCRDKFRARCGVAMPPRDATSHPDFPALVEFQSDSLCDFMRDARAVIRASAGNILFYANANPLYPSRINARCNRKMAECQDILAAEGGFLGGDLMTEAPLWKVSLNAKYLEAQASAARVPTLVFDCVTHTPWSSYPLPAGETTLLWASSVAHGAGTWMSCFKDAMDRPGAAAIGPAFALARRLRGELFGGTRSIADIAMLVSDATLNYYAGADVPQTDFSRRDVKLVAGNATREMEGWYHALWSNQIPFDLLDDRSIEDGDLARYRLLILPNSACLTDRCAARIRAFVEGGGAAVASFETGLYDGIGRRRDVGALDALLGIRRGAPDVQPARRWDYLFDHADPARPASLANCIPSPAYALDVTAATPDTRVLMTFSAALADRYVDLAEDSGRPAVVERAAGRGRALYFACDFGAALRQYRLPEHQAIVRDLAWRTARPHVRFAGAPPCLEVSLRCADDGRAVFLHLVNYDGGMTRPIERVLPVHDLEFSVRDLGRVGTARAMVAGTRLEPSSDGDDWTSFRLRVLHEYEMIRIDTDPAVFARRHERQL